MAATGTRLVPGSVLTNSTATYYTATNLSARIDKCVVLNTTSGAETFSLHLVPLGGSASAANQLVDAQSVNAHQNYTCPEVVGQWILNGGTIQAVASAGSALTLMVSGIEVT